MASSTTPINAAAARQLGQFLTGTEARELADRLTDGDTLTAALKVIAAGRRPEVRALLERGSGPGSPGTGQVVAMLRAVEGARSITTSLDPLWTMPGHLAQSGPLTSSVAHLVDSARQSVTCSTFNFQRSSELWGALGRAAGRPEIDVRIYLDSQAADRNSKPGSPTTAEVAAHLRPGIVLRTREFDGGPVRNHAKFLAIDHRFLLVTSANFSWSAEYGNVEFGVLIDNPNLTESVEREIYRVEDQLYERV
ncbi:DISARM system phospholipase D-like protein DrmC [Kitasatospora sp. NRRL B-11411]|uniref:DISARM system phospholipase D-like protein DrmC n=1 Tax=Kitasatospora sp. NRRL B-11411 TaxID=1463822 RepID=UPI0004C44464|nr:DISARM system phospholipase D-like protein DrmC [Kitasatospora sp. NRRL B-11411]